MRRLSSVNVDLEVGDSLSHCDGPAIPGLECQGEREERGCRSVSVSVVDDVGITGHVPMRDGGGEVGSERLKRGKTT